MKKRYNLFLLLVASMLFAQPNTSADLQSGAENGLYKIAIPAAIRAFSQENLADFRIYDANQNEVPYAVLPAQNTASNYQFKPFSIISQTVVPKQHTTVIVGISKTETSEITLYIANAEVTKKFSISGSNDQNQWFGLVNNRVLSDIQNERSASDYKSIPLPLNNYKFLKIVFDDKKTLPLNVLQAGYFTSDSKPPVFENITPDAITTSRNKSEKTTLIKVGFKNPQSIDKIQFAIRAPNLFSRQVRIYKNVVYKIRKKTRNRQETLAAFELHSGKTNTFHLLPIAEKEWFIEISDRDNPPLEISTLTISQQQVFIVTDLKANSHYTIKTGDSQLSFPDYDIQNTISPIGDSLPNASITDIKHQSEIHSQKADTETLWQKPWFMWLCIGLGGLLITYFSITLVKDLNKKP